MTPIITHEIIDHGVEHEQYFQGCGVAFTEYNEVFTGIGDSAYEALDDALENAAMSGYDVSGVENTLSDEPDLPGPELDDDPESIADADACWHYVSIRIKTTPDA